jgi:RNA methyltransferase, TrmH family
MYPQVSKNKLKYITSLLMKKNREVTNRFLAAGDKIVREVLEHQNWNAELVIATAEWCEKNASLCEKAQVELFVCSETELAKASGLKTPNQALVVVWMPNNVPDFQPIDTLALYLDGIQDPGNLGTILRIADWFGIPQVFRSPDTVDLYNPKVIQATMGSFLRVKSPEISLSDLKKNNPQWIAYGALLDGKDVFQTDFKTPALLIIGNEGKGISAEILSLVDQPISILKHANGGAESLNAAVATGIICAALRSKA